MEKISERFGKDPREWYRRGLLTDRELVEAVGEEEARLVFGEAEVHTCPIGPLCRAWPWNEYDDSDWRECDHGSCLAIVNEDCPACFEEIARAFAEAEREAAELVQAATCWCGRFGNAHDRDEEAR